MNGKRNYVPTKRLLSVMQIPGGKLGILKEGEKILLSWL